MESIVEAGNYRLMRSLNACYALDGLSRIELVLSVQMLNTPYGTCWPRAGRPSMTHWHANTIKTPVIPLLSPSAIPS